MGIMGAIKFLLQCLLYLVCFRSKYKYFQETRKNKKFRQKHFTLNNTSYKDILANKMFYNIIECHTMN